MIDIISAIVAVIITVILAIFAPFLNTREVDIPQPPPAMEPKIGAAANLSQLFSDSSEYGKQAASLIADRNPPTIARVSDIPQRMPYTQLVLARRAAHVGQFKLQFSEVQFLTECLAGLPLDSEHQIFVIYAGSGPGHSRQNLADMFPMMKFVLIDPQEHDIKGCAPNSKLYFRSARPARALADEVIDFATPDGIIQCTKSEAPTQMLDPEQIANVIMRERGYTFYIIEDLFTDDLARAFAKLGTDNNVSLFISDIRTNFEAPGSRPGKFRARDQAFDDEADNDSPSDMDIIINNIWQHTWVNLMRPAQCMLKFRTPFMNPRDIELVRAKSPQFARDIEQYNATFHTDILAEYLARRYLFMASDHINIQVFAGPTSTETRLIAGPADYARVVPYDPREHEERMFYYNMMREYCFYEQNRAQFHANIGLDGCADCNLALHIAREYIAAVARFDIKPRDVNVSSPVALISQSLARMHRSLRAELHGSITQPYRDLRDAADHVISASTARRTQLAIQKSGRGRPRRY